MLLFYSIFFSMNKDFLLSQSEKAPEGQIHFIASKDFENIDFFQNITEEGSDYDFSNLEVYINGELTDQVANSISASANDDIIIKATRGKYPYFGRYTSSSSRYNINYIKSIEEPFPLMHQANGETITNFGSCFYNCSSLTSIPAGLFDKNTQVTSFNACFHSCSSLTVNVQIGSTASRISVGNFANRTKSEGTVYCRAGSAAYTAFTGSSNANVNVLTY